MEVNFDEYLTEDERKEIIKSVFHAKCVQAFERDAERIFSNAAYSVVYKVIDDYHNGTVATKIAQKALEVIDNLSEHTVFRPQDPWGNKQSPAYKTLQEIICAKRETISNRLDVVLSEIKPEELADLIREEAVYLIETKLFGKSKP